MTYATEHADALEQIREAGAAVTFDTSSRGTHDPETGLHASPVAASVAGVAIEVRPNRAEQDAYRAAGLSADRVVCLLFAASTFGAVIPLGATVAWGTDTLTVKGVTRIAPDSTAIIARVWCVR